MIEYIIIFAISFIIGYICRKVLRMRKELNEWDPFDWDTEMTTELICEQCGMKKVREWDDGDFIFVKTKDKCPSVCKKPKCKGPMVVHAIYFMEKKTKEELKWEKVEAKWR